MAGETDTPQLVLTKLHRPRVSDDFVPRPHLLDRLKQGLDRRLTLVSATPMVPSMAGFENDIEPHEASDSRSLADIRCPTLIAHRSIPNAQLYRMEGASNRPSRCRT
jgi:hypothetical protein